MERSERKLKSSMNKTKCSIVFNEALMKSEDCFHCSTGEQEKKGTETIEVVLPFSIVLPKIIPECLFFPSRIT